MRPLLGKTALPPGHAAECDERPDASRGTALKTTLKRGVGRSATGNGNGHAVFPPGPISTITRYEQPPPPGRSGVARALAHPARDAARRCSRSGSRPPAAATSGSTSPSTTLRADVEGRDRDRRRCSTCRVAHKPAVALVVGYDYRFGDDPNDLALGHADADPRRPGDEVDLDALVPARPDRRRLLPGRDAGPRPHQLGVRALRLEGHARDGPQADGHPDQLPDHGQLPRLPADRRQARRRLARHRPPLLQRQRRHARRRTSRTSTSSRATSG